MRACALDPLTITYHHHHPSPQTTALALPYLILPPVRVDGRVAVHDVDHRQPVALPDLVVVGVVAYIVIRTDGIDRISFVDPPPVRFVFDRESLGSCPGCRSKGVGGIRSVRACASYVWCSHKIIRRQKKNGNSPGVILSAPVPKAMSTYVSAMMGTSLPPDMGTTTLLPTRCL